MKVQEIWRAVHGTVVECHPSIIDALNKVRDIYIRGFKQGDDDAMMEFYAQSMAQFYVIGGDKMNEKFDWIGEKLSDVFGELFLKIGRQYVMGYINALSWWILR